MSIEMARDIFLWCTIINYGFLLLWALAFLLARDWMYRLHGRWFRLTPENFDVMHYCGMGIYKIGILLFFLAPLLALYIVR